LAKLKKNGPTMQKFRAEIQIIGINPYVLLPKECLSKIAEEAGKEKGHIPVRGAVNGKPYQQTLVKYSGAWRLYVNAKMLDKSPKRIGERVEISVEFDPSDRTIEPHPKLVRALHKDKEAKKIFERLSPSMQQGIIRYIAHLKTEESIDRNVWRAVNFLNGKGSFAGRKNP